jgi:capsular exopolysaccharide synthesis family protein
VIKSYEEFLEQQTSSGKQDVLERITRKADDVLAELRRKQQNFVEFQTASEQLKGADGTSEYHQTRLADIEAQRLALQVEAARLRQLLKTMEKAQESGTERETLATLEPALAMTSSGTDGRQINEYLMPLLLREQQLLRDFGPGHRELINVRQQMDFIKEHFGYKDKEVKPDNVGLTVNVKNYMDKLRFDIERLEATDATLKAAAEDERLLAREVTRFDFESSIRRDEIAQMQSYYDGLIQQLQSMSFSKDLPVYTTRQLIAPTPAVRVAPRTVLIMAGSVFFGGLTGLVLAGLNPFARQRFRDSYDVSRTLGAAVMGQIAVASVPRRKRTGSGLDPMLRTYHEPDSLVSEAYRGLRTMLLSCCGGARVIQVTSPAPGDGKSTMVSNLAVSLARSGRKVLLIDADLRRPRLHRIFSLNNERGLSDLLHGTADWKDVVMPSGAERLSVIPSGPVPNYPADLLAGSALSAVLQAAVAEYDFVLIDTPPILDVTDAQIVAVLADGVLLVLPLAHRHRQRASRACEILADLNAKMMGIVVRAKKTELSQHYISSYTAS